MIYVLSVTSHGYFNAGNYLPVSTALDLGWAPDSIWTLWKRYGSLDLGLESPECSVYHEPMTREACVVYLYVI